ncbi:MAG: hypothetical protein KF703_18865 [Actinobacteria bacterium]|nr:hypothetical protein [Actinomycetota bacterium]
MLRDDPHVAARALASDLGAELVVGGPATEELVERLSAAVGRGPRLDLDALDDAVRRAEETRDRTRAAVAEQLSQKLHTALAIHPDTLRRAATDVVDAADRADRARRRTEPRAAARLRTTACGVLALSGVAVVGLGSLPGGIAVVLLGLLAAVVSWQQEVRRVERAIPPHLDAEVALAGATRRWEQLVGPGIDPSDVEAVVARYDPQHDLVADLVEHHPAVRAVEHLAAVRHEALEAATQALITRAAGASAGGPPATTVVAAPYDGLSEERCRALHRRLLALPTSLRVIVVLAPGPNTDDGRVLDLTDPPEVGTRADLASGR